jgi:hypothetical protein
MSVTLSGEVVAIVVARRRPQSGTMRLLSGCTQLGLEHNEVPVERPEFELDVVRVAKHNERPPGFLLHARVLDPVVIEVLRPGFERSTVRNVERKMVEADCTLVEPIGDGVRARARRLVCTIGPSTGLTLGSTAGDPRAGRRW